MLLGARYYDPSVGRFISRDPIGYQGGLNLYGYCSNDPTNRIDPDGKDSTKTPHGQAEMARIAVDEAKRNANGFLRAGEYWDKVARNFQQHHVLSQKYREQFAKVFGDDIIDRFTLKVPDWAHHHLHYVVKWNSRWAQFFESNPNATPLQTIRYAKELLREGGLGDVRLIDLIPYPK